MSKFILGSEKNMAEVNVTPILRDTIKNYRKELKIRGDELSKKLRKNTSFISQLETGKIETISTSLLYKIFDELFKNDSNKEQKINDTFKQMQLSLSDKELERQEWMTIMDLQYRKIPITDSIIQFIQNNLQELNITSNDLIDIINKNSDLINDYSQEDIDGMEDNKVYPTFKKSEDDASYIVGMHIKFNLPDTYIEDIVNKKIKRCNFVTMQGIIYNIYSLKGIADKEAIKQAENFLYEQKFYTIMYKQYLTRHKLVDELADYDIDFNKKMKKLNSMLSSINDSQPNLLNNILGTIIKNLDNQPGLTLSVFKRNLDPLKQIPVSEQKLFMKDFDKLLKEYSTHTEANDKNKIETF